MWVVLAVVSALGLGFYDVMKKLSVRDNNVLIVLMLNTVFGAVLMSPVVVMSLADGSAGFSGAPEAHPLIIVKSLIVLGSWLLGYFAIKHLPLTIQGPVNASRPVMVLAGAVLIFGERLNAVQWAGLLLGFASLFLISRIGAGEGFSLKKSRWLWFAIGAAVLGAVSALFDKFLLRHYAPLDVQAWYSLYQCAVMTAVIAALRHFLPHTAGVSTPFRWRWTIVFISVFLTLADMAYFYSLSLEGAMISVVSMIRRGSVVIPFLYGVVVLHERNIRAKAVDLGILIVSLVLLVVGSAM